MRDNDVSVKRSSVFSRMFGAVHRAVLRCVAVVAIALSTLFAFDVTSAQAAGGAQCSNGVCIGIKIDSIPSSTGYVDIKMAFRFTGSLYINCGGGSYGTDEGELYNSSGTFLGTGDVSVSFNKSSTTTLTCRYYDTNDGGAEYRAIQLKYKSVTGYSQYSAVLPKAGGIPDTDTTYTFSTFRFSSGQQYIYQIHTDSSFADVFPTIGTGGEGNQPLFIETFKNCTNLQMLGPSASSGQQAHLNVRLFWTKNNRSISGTGAQRMFYGTFRGCTNVKAIPWASNNNNCGYGFFPNVTPASYMFAYAFMGTGLENLNPSSACSGNASNPFLSYILAGGTNTADYMFYYTFANNTALTSLPDNLFGPFTGDASTYMFAYTFSGCTGLTTVNKNIFSNMTTTIATRMFVGMFSGCTGITSLPSGLFDHFTTANSSATYVFSYTFSGCNNSNFTSLTTIFSGMGTTPGNYMFDHTFYGCSGLTSLPSNLFSRFTGTSATGMFSYTFANCTGLTSLNSGIFNSMNQTPATRMFEYMFSGCTGLTYLPSSFFARFTGSNTSATYVFSYTFNGCTGLNGANSLTGNTSGGASVFAGVPVMGSYMFQGTFNGCTGLPSLPAGLFGTAMTGTLPTYMFNKTFSGCTNLTSLNTNVFSGLNTVPSNYIFWLTFENCTRLTTVTNALFQNFTGKPSNYMFYQTFKGCTSLVNISNIFYYVGSSTAANNKVLGQYMFSGTFYGCTAVKPSQYLIFSPFSGWTLAVGTFYQTFYNCTGTVALNGNLFAGIKGTPSNNAFQQTFYGCTGLYGEISAGLFSGLSGAMGTNTFYQTFYNCSKLGKASSSASTGTHYIYPGLFYNMTASSAAPVNGIFYNTALVESCPSGTTAYTGAPYNTISTNFNSKAVCEPTMPATKFSMTLTAISAGDVFAFNIYAKGDFYVRWQSGGPAEKVSTTSVTSKTFSHTYPTAAADGTITIELSSENVTGYVTSHGTAASYGTLNFSPTNGATSKTKIKSLGGSLGALFPTYSTGTSLGQQPFFAQTFSGATALESIPSGLFSGLTGDISSSGTYMFYRTFYGCTNLRRGIPENLFGNLSGTIPTNMFYQTFYNCTSLGKNSVGGTISYYIPPRLFMNFTKWSDTATTHMYQIFTNTGLATTSTTCSGFADAPYQFYTGYESGSTNNTNNSFGGKISCFNGLTLNTSAISSFTVPFAAAGNFYIGWGDDTFSQKSIASPTMYADSSKVSHTYTGSAVRRIQIGGTGTAYNEWAPVRFMGYGTITSIEGSVGYMFPGSPVFDQMFKGCSNLTSIPNTLFDGITAITERMFQGMFVNCTHLTTIPSDLFKGINGLAPAAYMFNYMFEGTSGLTQIPANLFANMGTTPANYMFRKMFYNSGLTSIPDTLFDRFNNKRPATGMFQQTFAGSTSLTGALPSGLFDGLTGMPNPEVFDRTFSGCTKLYGALPDTFTGMSGSIANSTFYQTFYGCTNLGKNAVNGTSTYYIPPTFFGGVAPNANATTPTTDMFAGTGLLTECPGVLNQYFTGFETFVDGSNSPKVSCKRCAYLPGQASYGNTCYNLCNLNGDNMTKLHVGDNWFHLFAQSEATNFAHHLNFKYGNNANDICFVPLDDSGWGASNSGSLNFGDGAVKYHAKRSGTTSRSGGEQTKTKQ